MTQTDAHLHDQDDGVQAVQDAPDNGATEATADADSSQAEPTEEAVVKLEAYQALQTEAQQYRDGWLRERSDFANYQRRTEREMKASRDNVTGDTYKTILPVIDDFERAMATVPADLVNTPWVNGVSMILRKFYKILEDNNVVILDPTGQPFDPSRHEAIGTDDTSDVESGTVTATMQKGYLVGERVLRPALVRIAR